MVETLRQYLANMCLDDKHIFTIYACQFPEHDRCVRLSHTVRFETIPFTGKLLSAVCAPTMVSFKA